MRILVVSQYFWPETFIINDLVVKLEQAGHQIRVLTGKPNYPEGAVYPGYREGGLEVERYGQGVQVLRVPMRARRGGGGRNLALNYLSFLWSGLRYFPRLSGSFQEDVVLVFASSPLTSAIPALWLKVFRPRHVVIWVQDLWPESLSATGFIRNRSLLGMLGLLVRAIYARADTLLVPSRAFLAPVARYARAEKIIYYPNSFDAAHPGRAGAASLPPWLALVLRQDFCVVFAGNIGAAQAADTLVQAAWLLRDVSGVKLVLVGAGSRLGWVRRRKAELALDNLLLTGQLPAASMPGLFSLADGLLVSLKREAIFAYTIPSKVQAYLAAGRPILAALDGEGARVIRESGAGLTSAAEDAPALAAQVRALFAMAPAQRARMGAAGRRYFLEHFDMDRQTQRLVEILHQRLGRTRSAA